jgi:hypothetical protein
LGLLADLFHCDAGNEHPNYVVSESIYMSVEVVQIGGGGGSGSSVSLLKKTFTDAEIKLLPTTIPVIVPAAGANKFLIFHRAMFVSHGFDVNPYTNLNFAGVSFCAFFNGFDPTGSSSPLLFIAGSANAWEQTFNTFFNGTFPIAQFIPNSAVSLPFVQLATSNVYSAIGINSGLVLGTNNGASGNFTGGNAANTLDIHVWYSIVNTA